MRNPQKKFGKIYDKYIDKIYRFVFLKVGSQEAAEDLTSQVFAKGWNKYRKVQSSKFKVENWPAYLYQIARAEVADYHRQRAKFKIISTESAQIVDPNPGPEENQQKQSELESIRDCLARLSNDHQNVVIWRYLDGLSHKEIAQIMEKPEGTVRVMAHRALKELREQMENL